MARPGDARADIAAAWNRAATGWERRNDDVARMAGEVSRRMVELLDPRPGETVLELAAGVGDTGFLAARALEPGGTLISTDVAEAMVAAACRRAAELGVGNVEHHVASADALPLPDESVDGALCRWGYMLMPDPAAALAETRRVLRPRGRLVLAVWAEADRNPWASVVGRTLVARGVVPPPDPSQPSMFALADRDRLAGLVRGAGFSSLELDEVEVAAVYRSFDAYWETTMDMSVSTADALAALPGRERAAVAEAVGRAAEPFTTEDGAVRLPGVCIVGLARR